MLSDHSLDDVMEAADAQSIRLYDYVEPSTARWRVYSVPDPVAGNTNKAMRMWVGRRPALMEPATRRTTARARDGNDTDTA